MDKSNLKVRIKKYIKILSKSDTPEETLNFICDSYANSDYVLGLHKTQLNVSSYSYFQNGLFNSDNFGKKSTDISNTVYYSGSLENLINYIPSGKHKNNTTIILKFPKDVFLQKQKVFEALEDGRFVIAPQFILGAIERGAIKSNPCFDPEYSSKDGEYNDKSESFSSPIDRATEVTAFKTALEYSKADFFHKILFRLNGFKKMYTQISDGLSTSAPGIPSQQYRSRMKANTSKLNAPDTQHLNKNPNIEKDR